MALFVPKVLQILVYDETVVPIRTPMRRGIPGWSLVPGREWLEHGDRIYERHSTTYPLDRSIKERLPNVIEF